MDSVNLQALNTSSFVFSRDLSPWADIYPLASGKFRAHMRLSVTDPVVYAEFSSDNRRAGYTQTKANGQLTFASNPTPGDTIELGFSSIKFLTAGPTVVIVPQSTVTMTIATPAVISWAAHGLPAGTPVTFAVAPGGSLATGIVGGTIYYIATTDLTSGTFKLSDTQPHALAGTNLVNTGGSQSGTIVGYATSTFALAAHGLTANTPINLYTTNTLPPGFASGITYYVLASLLASDTFQVAAAPAGTAILATGVGAGTQSLIAGHTVVLGATSGVTFTLGAPGTVNWATHGLPAGTPVQWTSTGNLPAPLAVGTIYYVSCGTGANVLTTGTFTLAANYADSQTGLNDITLGGSQSGTQTGIAPTTIVWAAHGLTPNTPVILTTTGTLPAPLLATVKYFVLQPLIETGTFQISATPGGAPIFFPGTQTGIQMASAVINALPIGAGLPQTMTSLVAWLNGSTDPQISLASYSASGSGILNVSYDNAGTVGNLFPIGASSSGVTVSNPTLQGGGGLLTLTAPISDICNFLGNFVYDCRWESLDGSTIVTLFGGQISFTQGITRSGDIMAPTLQLGPAVQIANLPTPIGNGELILCSDCGGGIAVLEAVSGVWRRMNEESFFIRGDSFGNITFTVLANANIQMFQSTLTGNVAISLSSTRVYAGAYFRVIAPSSLGGFSFTIQGQSLTAGQYASFLWNGSVWQISGLGAY